MSVQDPNTIPPRPQMVAGAPTHRHKKRGSTYTLIGFGKMQAEDWYEGDPDGDALNTVDMRDVAIYRSTDDGSLWVRPREEFEDGRFATFEAGVAAPVSQGSDHSLTSDRGISRYAPWKTRPP